MNKPCAQHQQGQTLQLLLGGMQCKPGLKKEIVLLTAQHGHHPTQTSITYHAAVHLLKPEGLQLKFQFGCLSLRQEVRAGVCKLGINHAPRRIYRVKAFLVSLQSKKENCTHP